MVGLDWESRLIDCQDQAVMRVVQDTFLRVRLRERGMARAQRFSFEKFTSCRADAIERLVSARRSC
jgi:hypothetical protein